MIDIATRRRFSPYTGSSTHEGSRPDVSVRAEGKRLNGLVGSVRGPWHVAVVIPARDEAELLPRCIHSVLSARTLLPSYVTSDIVVMVDDSIDATFRIAQELLKGVGVAMETNVGCVGSARSLGVRLALERYSGPNERCWLANTDADCVVPMTWLRDQLAIAKSGFSAVAGIVDVDSFEEHDVLVPERFRLSYLIHPDGTHPHVHGANLGIRADAYVEAGGWHDLATAEDHDLWRRLHHVDHNRIADARLCVTTSGRRVGRAPLGFAAALAAHNGVAV